MTQEQQIIRAKVGLLELAKQLGLLGSGVQSPSKNTIDHARLASWGSKGSSGSAPAADIRAGTAGNG